MPGNETLQPIRVLLADLPPMLAEVVTHALNQHESIEIADSIRGPVDILSRAAEIDVIVLGIEQIEPLPVVWQQLLLTNPRLKILTLADHENTALGYWVDIRRCRIQHVTGGKLAEGIYALFERKLEV